MESESDQGMDLPQEVILFCRSGVLAANRGSGMQGFRDSGNSI